LGQRRTNLLVDIAVRALAETDWPGEVGPHQQPVVPWLAPEWRGDD